MVPKLLLVAFIPIMVSRTVAQSPGIHHWPLNEEGGTVAIDHAGTSHGTLVGGAEWAPDDGYFAGAARFNGVQARIETGPCDLVNGAGAISITAWVKPDLVTGMERTLIAKANGPDDHVWSLAIVNATALRFRLLAAGQLVELASSPSLITSGIWYFIAATYDGTEARLYVNGSMIASAPVTGTIGHHPGVPVAMGALHNGQHAFSGWMDDVRIHDQGLNDMDVLALLFENVSVGIDQIAPALGRPYHIELLDTQGRVLDRSVTYPDTTGRWPEEWSTGVHLVRMVAPGGTTTRRVFIP